MTNKKIQIPESILFVCTGNTCRSPMAEYLMKAIAEEKGLDIETASRGTSAETLKSFELGPAEEACDVVLELYPKSKIYTHLPEALIFKDVDKYSLILTMEERRRDEIIGELREYMPEIEKKVFSLKEYAGFEHKILEDRLDVQDPIGGGVSIVKSEDLPVNASSFSYIEVEQDGSKSYRVVDQDKRLKTYRDCRDEIKECLDKIANGTPDIEQILLNREKIKKAREELRKKSEIARYEKVLNSIESLKYGTKVYIPEDIEEAVKSKGGIEKYLVPYIEKIRKVADERELTLTVKPVKKAKWKQ